MGARISIDLQGLLQHPDVTVELFTETNTEPNTEAGEDDMVYAEHRAVVRFVKCEVVSYFSYSVHANKVTLEGDFNFFRNEDVHKHLMRVLFECSVPFTVIPG